MEDFGPNQNRGRWVWAAAILVASLGHDASAADAMTRIPVNLFGQPCILQGPLSEELLKQVHAVSPEQVDTGCREFPTEARIKESVSKLSAKGAPPSLDTYREKVRARLDRLAALARAADEARRTKSPLPLQKLAEDNKTFAPIAKKLVSADVARIHKDAELDQKIIDAYCEGLGSDPEEEFHRAIQKLKVQYLCSFDARDGMEEGGEE